MIFLILGKSSRERRERAAAGVIELWAGRIGERVAGGIISIYRRGYFRIKGKSSRGEREREAAPGE